MVRKLRGPIPLSVTLLSIYYFFNSGQATSLLKPLSKPYSYSLRLSLSCSDNWQGISSLDPLRSLIKLVYPLITVWLQRKQRQNLNLIILWFFVFPKNKKLGLVGLFKTLVSFCFPRLLGTKQNFHSINLSILSFQKGYKISPLSFV